MSSSSQHYVCDNCRFEDQKGIFHLAQDIEARLTPGSMYTDMECPECGALAYPKECSKEEVSAFEWHDMTDSLGPQATLSRTSELIGIHQEMAKGLRVIVSKDADRWHLSISCQRRDPLWQEIREARYQFIPDNIYMVMGLPPKDVYVNCHPHTFHLWETIDLKVRWIFDQM